MELSKDLIVQAYKMLKSEAYHETYNLYLKKRLADFEASVDISKLEEKLLSLEWYPKVDANQIRSYFENIEYRVVPKKLKATASADSDSCFISNESIFDSYGLEDVNLLIDCPIELHLLDTLWTMLVGPLIDKTLSDSCYGNRIDSSLTDGKSVESASRLFKFYVTQYGQWRDNAFSAIDSVVKRDNVTVVSLDIKKCYYSIRPEWKDVTDCIDASSHDEGTKNTLKHLTEVIKSIYMEYWTRVDKFSSEYTQNDKERPALPIGLSSSRVLCNFHLRKLDDEISGNLQPEYYGRYVDDVLIVLRTTDTFLKQVSKTDEINAKTLIDKYFLKTSILRSQKADSNAVKECPYSLEYDKDIEVQQSKFCVFLVKKKQSKSVLDNMKRELLRNVSDLRIMPTDIVPEKLDRAFFGSSDTFRATKFRDLFSKPNNTNLVLKEISKIMILAKSATISRKKTKQMIKSIDTLFQGINLLSNHLLWEKISTLMVLTGCLDALSKMLESIKTEVSKIMIASESSQGYSDKALGKIQDDLIEYSRISCAMALALTKIDENSEQSDLPHDMAYQIRQACLMRSEHISYPLLEYTDYMGILFCSLNRDSIFGCSIDKNKIRYSPRFIHLHEYLLAYYRHSLDNDDQRMSLELSKEEFYKMFGKTIFTEGATADTDEYIKSVSINEGDVSVRTYKHTAGELIRRDHTIKDSEGEKHGKAKH